MVSSGLVTYATEPTQVSHNMACSPMPQNMHCDRTIDTQPSFTYIENDIINVELGLLEAEKLDSDQVVAVVEVPQVQQYQIRTFLQCTMITQSFHHHHYERSLDLKKTSNQISFRIL